MREDIKKRRSDGMSIQATVQVFVNYLYSANQSLAGMISTGVFRSKTIRQAHKICTQVDFKKVSKAIRETLKNTGTKLPASQKHDRFARVSHCFWRVFEIENENLCFTAGNLEFAIESLVSQLGYRFGDDNTTW